MATAPWWCGRRSRNPLDGIDVELMRWSSWPNMSTRSWLFSGEGAFCSLVAALHRRGVRVSVVSSIATSPPMIASELRRQADVFMDLRDLQRSLGGAAAS
jgi:NYN domain